MPSPALTVQLLSVLNAVYLVASAGGLLTGYLYWRDVARDSRAVFASDRATEQDRALVARDLSRERWRFLKQLAVFVAIWIPLIVRPVLHENPDPYIYEFYRGILAFIAFGLFWNSYRDLKFRAEFRNRLIPPQT
jgi:hypothetical protein